MKRYTRKCTIHWSVTFQGYHLHYYLVGQCRLNTRSLKEKPVMYTRSNAQQWSCHSFKATHTVGMGDNKNFMSYIIRVIITVIDIITISLNSATGAKIVKNVTNIVLTILRYWKFLFNYYHDTSMCTCMYIYACMYVCMYVCMHACMYVCMYIMCTHVCMHTYMYIRTYVHTYIRMHAFSYIYSDG